MAKGKTHDKINICTLVILIWAAYFYFNFRNPLLLLVFSLSYIFGTLYLSPDLDMENTLPYKRWGRFRFIWYIYSKIIPHRSLLSHSVFVGTVLRLIWFLGGLFLTGFFIVWILHLISLGNCFQAYMDSWREVKFFFLNNRELFYALLAGLFLSSLLHEIVDVIWSFFKWKG